ncbi:MAG: CotH kinase family protein [Spirosomaceae bacterium]|nr:CotH kinase family protein [Spirosomataceae bacterium]
MDVENFIDYQIPEIYYNNVDWGYNNTQYWRLRVPYTPNAPLGHDGRWRWSLFDLDAGLSDNLWTENRLAIASSFNNWWEPGFLLGKLLENQEFKYAFINRFADMLNSAFLPSRLSALMNEMKDNISGVMPAHLDRWKTLSSMSAWQSEINKRIDFINNRPAFQRQHIRSKFGISGEFNLSVNVDNPAVNSIHIQSTTPGVSENPYPWTGSYFDNIPLQIKAHPNAGYQFKHWIVGNTTITTNPVTLNTANDVSYTAVFEEVLLSSNPIPGAFSLTNPCGYRLNEWSNTNPAGTYPDSMRFVYMDVEEPPLSANIAGFTTGSYNHSSRTRISGKGANGFSFINTSGSVNVGYPNTAMGGALLALNTLGKTSVSVRWTGRTFTPNPRQYRIRLRYRVGDLQPFQDLLDESGQPVEYIRNATAGHSQVFSTMLPSSLVNQPYIQLLWQYYYTGVGTSGARDELGVDDIAVTGQADLSGTVSANLNVQEGTIISLQNIQPSAVVNYTAGKFIQLNPGFQTSSGTVFTAQIGGCN